MPMTENCEESESKNCRYQIMSKSIVNKHFNNHHNTNSQCNNTLQKLKTHLMQKPFACVQCDYKYSLKKHFKVRFGEKSYHCQHCDYKTLDYSRLRKHILLHITGKLLNCKQCDFKTVNKNRLKKHVLTHNRCNQCNYKTMDKNKLKRHALVLHNVASTSHFQSLIVSHSDENDSQRKKLCSTSSYIEDINDSKSFLMDLEIVPDECIEFNSVDLGIKEEQITLNSNSITEDNFNFEQESNEVPNDIIENVEFVNIPEVNEYTSSNQNITNEDDTEFEENNSTGDNFESSDFEYLPDISASPENNASSDLEIEDTTVTPQFPYRDVTETVNNQQTAGKDGQNYGTSNKLKRKRIRKHVLCPLCFIEVQNFARHLIRTHRDDESVEKIIKMPSKSKERRYALSSLRKRGNFVLQQQKNVVIPVRTNEKSTTDYMPCNLCLGFYKKGYLGRHRKKCQPNSANTDKRQHHLANSQTLLAMSGQLGNYLNNSRLKEEVFSTMRADEISYTVKTDIIICLFGEYLLNKQGRTNTSVSNKLREVARFKISLKENLEFEQLIDILKPNIYEHLVAAAKRISGYNSEKNTLKASSLAMQIGRSLKTLCSIGKSALMSSHPLLSMHVNKDEVIKDLMELRKITENNWCNHMDSLAPKELNDNPKLLQITEDLKLLNNYVMDLAEKAYEQLTKNNDVAENYASLSETTLTIVLIFNSNRIREIQFLTIDDYKQEFCANNQQECLASLSEVEKQFCRNTKRVAAFGEGSKAVPLLFNSKMQRFVETIIAVRETTDIVPKTNKYIFAKINSEKWIDGIIVLHKLALQCGATCTKLLTSARFGKQLSTVLQLMHFEQDELSQLATFMGYTEETRTDFYRLLEDVHQTAKAAKVLLLINTGQGSTLKGKSLAEIELNDDSLEDLERKANEDLAETELNEDSLQELEGNSNDGEETDENKFQIKGRKRWSKTEKKCVISFFKSNITNKSPPKKEDCIKFIDNNQKLFQGFERKDWTKIKTLVYNTYRSKN